MGSQALQKLKDASVTVVGLGGVGSWCAEMLVRSGMAFRFTHAAKGLPRESV